MQTGKLFAQRSEIISPSHIGHVEQEGDKQTSLLWYLFHPYSSHQGRHGSTVQRRSALRITQKETGQVQEDRTPNTHVLPAELASTQQGSLIFVLRLDLVYKAAAQLPGGLGLFPEMATF